MPEPLPFQPINLPDMLKLFDFNALFYNSETRLLSDHDYIIGNRSIVADKASTTSNKWRIRVQTLFSQLSSISVCLYQGPGFDRRTLDEAISSSIIHE